MAGQAISAFRIEFKILQWSGIWFSTSAGKARYEVYCAAKDAGYSKCGFGDFKVRRAPEFDALFDHLGLKQGHGYAVFSCQQWRNQWEDDQRNKDLFEAWKKDVLTPFLSSTSATSATPTPMEKVDG